MVKKKIKSKRQTTRHRAKVVRKVAEHHRKQRKEARKKHKETLARVARRKELLQKEGPRKNVSNASNTLPEEKGSRKDNERDKKNSTLKGLPADYIEHLKQNAQLEKDQKIRRKQLKERDPIIATKTIK